MDTNPVLMNKLSMDSDIPLYSQLVSIIKRNISAGTLTPGALLPSEAELCRTFDVSRSTVRQAIGALESEGLVVRNAGRQSRRNCSGTERSWKKQKKKKIRLCRI